MELTNFRGTIYGKYGKQLFIWDTLWETFRPIEKIGWNGREITYVDTKYKDLFSPWYGYGSEEMKKLCKMFPSPSEIAETDIQLKGVFWKDRECCFISECVSRNTNSWKRYLKYMNSKHKTLRKHNESKHTKRNLK